MIAAIAALKEEVAGVLRAGSFRALDAPGEALAYRGRVAGGPDTILLLTGTGGPRAEAACSWLFRSHRPEAVLCLGFAGGARDSLATGELVLATEIALLEGAPFEWGPESAGRVLSPDPAWIAHARSTVEVAGIDFRHGRIVSLPMVAKTPGMKRWVGQTCGAAAVDMESYRVAEAAAEAGVPFLCVRAIADRADMYVPDVVAEMEGRPSGGRLLPVLSYAARHPQRLSGLVRLAWATARARGALTAFTAACMRGDAAPAGSIP